MAVDNVALAVGPLIKLPHSVLAEQRQIVHDLLEIVLGPGVAFFSHIRPPRHKNDLTIFRFLFAMEKISTNTNRGW